MNLFEQRVSWVRRRGEDFHLLTIGLDTYASDSRFSLEFEGPNDWRLQLKSATERDAGLYECQVSVHPPLIRTVHLSVSDEEKEQKRKEKLSRREANKSVEMGIFFSHYFRPIDRPALELYEIFDRNSEYKSGINFGRRPPW
uniref:Ig-like domain-containing protein n=1 Tax=Vespula pensylvanica TaxID=30213 RepID=A0A834UA64_VESPE|nr:hypothetical protein H0235_007820 [Vespula pensylvanica]